MPAPAMSAIAVLALASLLLRTQAAQPSVGLQNAAVAGLRMPAIGIGTGGYGRYYANDSEVSEGAYAGAVACAMCVQCGHLAHGSVRLWPCTDLVILQHQCFAAHRVTVG